MNQEFERKEVWGKLLLINKIIQSVYDFFTVPFSGFLGKIITRLPFSSFYFRPVYLDEFYMAIGFWEPFVRQVLESLLTKTRNVLYIDVGANIGYYVVFASRYLGKNGFIIAVEPDRRNLTVLYRNIKANNVEHILVHEVALGPDGFLYLTPETNPMYTRTSETLGKLRVQSISLDSLYEQFKDGKYDSVVVKIDVEGGESNVVLSGSRFIRELSPTLIVEMHTHINAKVFDEITNQLTYLGYTCEQIFGRFYVFRKEKSQPARRNLKR